MGPELGLIMGGVQALGSVVGGLQQASQAKYAQKVAQANADQERLDAAEEAKRQRANAVRIAGTRRAIAGAAGVEGGSVIDAGEDLAAQMELDALTTLYMGERAAGRYEQEAAAAKMRRSAALGGAILGVGEAAIGGLDRYYSYRDAKKPQTGVRNPYGAGVWGDP